MSEQTSPPAPAFVTPLPATREALAFASGLHAGQKRDWDGAPFILHPLEVASALSNTGWEDDVVAAGVLHDVVEDTEVTVDELEARFGEPIARLVSALTEDPRIEDYEQRKAALRRQAVAAGPEARAVFAADKVTKVRELRAQIAWAPGDDDSSWTRRLAHYDACLESLEEHDADVPLVRQLRFELWALRCLPPRDAR